VLGSGTGECGFTAGKLSVSVLLVPWVGPGGSGAVPGRDGVGSGNRYQCQTGGGALVFPRIRVCLGILRCATLARKTAVCVVLTNHSRVSFHRSHHLLITRKLNPRVLLFSNFSPLYLDWTLYFVYCGERKPYFCHVGHIQCKSYIGLFQLYPTSLPWYCCRHVASLQEISCSIK